MRLRGLSPWKYSTWNRSDPAALRASFATEAVVPSKCSWTRESDLSYRPDNLVFCDERSPRQPLNRGQSFWLWPGPGVEMSGLSPDLRGDLFCWQTATEVVRRGSLSSRLVKPWRQSEADPPEAHPAGCEPRHRTGLVPLRSAGVVRVSCRSRSHGYLLGWLPSP